jgi:hypothetical protein
LGVTKAADADKPHIADHYELRAITQSDTCPQATVDAKAPENMKLRAAKNADTFPVTTCVLTLGDKVDEVKVGHLSLHGDKISTIEKIHILGDTGCDDKAGQSCGDKKSWPYSTVTTSLASDKDAKLIIHMGDYVYRSKLPVGVKQDSFENWDFEVFKPGKALLEKAPLVFVRGNHESCNSGKEALEKDAPEGYMRFFDVWDYTFERGVRCEEVSPSYVFETAKEASFLVLDSSEATSVKKDYDNETAKYELVATKLKEDVNKFKAYIDDASKVNFSNFLLTHRTVWGCAPAIGGLTCSADGYLLREHILKGVSFGNKLLSVISGHIHTFAMTSFSDAEPMQIVIGNGGTAQSRYYRLGIMHDGSRAASQGVQETTFGYSVLKLDASLSLGLTTFNEDGKKQNSYLITNYLNKTKFTQ